MKYFKKSSRLIIAALLLSISMSILFSLCNYKPVTNNGRLSFYKNNILLTQITMQVAQTNEWLAQQHLMYQNQMPFSCGMLFIFEQASDGPFRMEKNHQSFDVLFVAPNNKIVIIQKNVRSGTVQILSSHNLVLYKYVVVVNSDFCNSYDVSENDSVSFILTNQKSS